MLSVSIDKGVENPLTDVNKAIYEKLEANLRTAAAVSGTKIEPQNDKDLNKFTFQAAMRAALTGKVEGIVKEMDQEARNEARYTGQTYKGIAIPASILTRTWLTAEVGTLDILKISCTIAFSSSPE